MIFLKINVNASHCAMFLSFLPVRLYFYYCTNCTVIIKIFIHFQMTEESEWVLSVGESIKEQCTLVLNRNMSLWVKPEGPPNAITQYFCPTVSCYGKGVCNNGK